MSFTKLKWNWSEKIHSIAKKKNDHESFCMGLKYVHENQKKKPVT